MGIFKTLGAVGGGLGGFALGGPWGAAGGAALGAGLAGKLDKNKLAKYSSNSGSPWAMPNGYNQPGQYENALSAEAMSPMGVQGQHNIDLARSNAMGSAQNSLTNLAAKGGLDSGARERTLQAGNRLAAEGTQSAVYGNALQRNSLLQGLMSAEEQRKANQMSAWAANQSSNAQMDVARNSGGLFGSGGVLGLGI